MSQMMTKTSGDLTTSEFVSLDQLPRSRQKYISKKSNLPIRFVNSSVTNLNVSRRVQEHLDAFMGALVDNTTLGKGLLLWGRPGRGKTTVAAAVVRDALARVPRDTLGRTWEHDAIHPAYWISYSALVELTKRAFNDDDDAEHATDLLTGLHHRVDLRPWENVHILGLDDVGKEHSPKRWDGKATYSSAVLHDLLRSRYDKAAPTVVTTNLRPEEFAEYYGEATASFIHEAFDVVEVIGRDKRGG
jgi:DNA replication protein DnaC